MAYVNSSENMPRDNAATLAFLERFRQTALAALTGTQYQHEVQFVDKVVQKLDAGISLAKNPFISEVQSNIPDVSKCICGTIFSMEPTRQMMATPCCLMLVHKDCWSAHRQSLDLVAAEYECSFCHSEWPKSFGSPAYDKALNLRMNLVRQGLIEKRPIHLSSSPSDPIPDSCNGLDRNTWPYFWTPDWNGYKANEPVVVGIKGNKLQEFFQRNGDNALFIDPPPKLGDVQTIQLGSSGNLTGMGKAHSKRTNLKVSIGDISWPQWIGSRDYTDRLVCCQGYTTAVIEVCSSSGHHTYDDSISAGKVQAKKNEES
ncbi:MAG: hypothetical protein Q9204_006054 [Flavoplaca sp. TL-2023a]